MKKQIILTGLMIITSLNLHAQIQSQWRGPDRSGVYPETGLLKVWPQNGPELIWSADQIYEGYASPAVTKDAIYVTGRRDSLELLTAFDKTGKRKWQIIYGTAPKRTFQETRSTPTVDGDRLYLVSGLGDIVCIPTDGKGILWQMDGFNTFEGEFGRWEVSESPLIVDDKLIYTPAGHKTTMVALNKMNGNTLWTSEPLNDVSAYVSPICIQRGGRKIIIGMTATYLFGVDAADGKMLWSYDYSKLRDSEIVPVATDINCNTPLYSGGRIFVTSGYDHVGAMFTLSEDGSQVALDWITPALDTHHGHTVLVDGHIYGSNWINNRAGNWVSLDWETGDVKYETQWHTKGAIISAEGMLYCYDEKAGNLALVKATPDGFNPVSEFRIDKGKGPHWGHPVIEGGVLYIRHGDALMAYDIKG